MPPKYQAIASELKAQIQAGKYQDTNMLPTEFSLIDEFQVSRQTIRQALAILEQDGYIEKRRGSGSHLLPTAPNQIESSPPIAPSLSSLPISAIIFSLPSCGKLRTFFRRTTVCLCSLQRRTRFPLSERSFKTFWRRRSMALSLKAPKLHSPIQIWT